MNPNAAALMKRAEGRLFAEEGRLFLVLDVAIESQTARVSCQLNGERQILTLPLEELSARLSVDRDLKLDGLASSGTTTRVARSSDGWYFNSRAGDQGPFASEEEATAALGRYVVSAQSQRAV